VECLGEDPERCHVDGLDLVGGQDLDRTERVDEAPPWELSETDARGPARPPPLSGCPPLGRRLGSFVHSAIVRAARPGERPVPRADPSEP